MMREVAIFIISLPLLVFAVLWVPMGLMFVVVASPIFLMLTVIGCLRGESPDWGLFIMPPLFGFSMYLDVTGFFPSLESWIDGL